MSEHTSLFRPVVWITGASQGIGKALSLAMVNHGMTVIASARNRKNLEALQAESAGSLGQLEIYPLDVTDKTAVNDCVNYIFETFGRIDQAVLNAGTFIPMHGKNFSTEIMQKQIDLNLMGVCYCIEPLITIMQQQNQGVIAINASLSGYRGLPLAAAYGASKAALINMAECLKLDLQLSGIDVKVINPGFVKTPLTDKNKFPMPFLMTSEKAAQIILKGLNRSGFEIRFPAFFSFFLKVLQMLPYSLYFKLVQRFTLGGVERYPTNH